MEVKLKFDDERCKSCELCVYACPMDVLKINSEVLNSRGFAPVEAENIKNCTACACCAKICPDSVISISIA